MGANRLFMIGVVLLLLGIQFRIVESFELNEMATKIVEKRLPGKSADPLTSLVSQNSYSDPWMSSPMPSASKSLRVKHPRQMALLFISVGSVMILVSPAYKK